MRAIARADPVSRVGDVVPAKGTARLGSEGEIRFCIVSSAPALQFVAPSRATGLKHNHTELFSDRKEHFHAKLTGLPSRSAQVFTLITRPFNIPTRNPPHNVNHRRHTRRSGNSWR